jgi:succinate dehydrogenase/fumarate reductase flavoprotein subunit
MVDNRKVDVVVIGGGPAGMAAAIAAHDGGASVALLEAANVFGGTGAWSVGAIWIPGSRYARPGSGNIDGARRYMLACAGDSCAPQLIDIYLTAGPEVVDYLDENTPLDFTAGTMPDYEGGVPGGVFAKGASRSIGPAAFDLNKLGEHRDLIRRSPHGNMPFSFVELEEMGASLRPERFDWPEYQRRVEDGLVGWGEALSGGLLAGVLERNVAVFPAHRATRLEIDPAGRVVGVNAQSPNGAVTFSAVKGVVLACGGFEWDESAMAENFPIPIAPATVPTNRGDGLAMAKQAGAALGNMDQQWGWPGYIIPGETLPDGNPLIRTSLSERVLPHIICINSKGERFIDETFSYHRILKAMSLTDGQGNPVNLPAYHIFDGQFRAKYNFGPVVRGSPDPDWLKGYATLANLADAIGVPAAALQTTIDQYNAAVAVGRDDAVGRGGGGYAQFFGDPDNHPTPNLGTIAQAPFYAVEMIPTTIGTCGGPRTDGGGRVLNQAGQPIAGLYGAGNVAAAFSGTAYFGPGGTIGPALVFGVLAGRNAALGQ